MIRMIFADSVDEGNRAFGGGLGWIARAVAELTAQDEAARARPLRMADPLVIVLELAGDAAVPTTADLDPHADGRTDTRRAHQHLFNARPVSMQALPTEGFARPGYKAFRLG
jgi:hypothetical protein